MAQRGLISTTEFNTPHEILAQLHNNHEEFPVIVLQNNYSLRLFNGQLLKAKVRALPVDEEVVDLQLTDENGKVRYVTSPVAGFASEKPPQRFDRSLVMLDFGSAITAHKSQGSEWDSVAVYDDTFARMEDRARWRYTAATRAKSKLVWVL